MPENDEVVWTDGAGIVRVVRDGDRYFPEVMTARPDCRGCETMQRAALCGVKHVVDRVGPLYDLSIGPEKVAEIMSFAVPEQEGLLD